MRGHRVELSEKAHSDVLLGVELLLFGQRHLDARENEEHPEHVDEPMKALEQTHPCEDENKAHKRRPYDAPEQHTVLVPRRHLEIGENKNEDKNIVNA
jgi:hypothetical protein